MQIWHVEGFNQRYKIGILTQKEGTPHRLVWIVKREHMGFIQLSCKDNTDDQWSFIFKAACNIRPHSHGAKGGQCVTFSECTGNLSELCRIWCTGDPLFRTYFYFKTSHLRPLGFAWKGQSAIVMIVEEHMPIIKAPSGFWLAFQI